MKKIISALLVFAVAAFAIISDPSLSGTLQGRGLRTTTSGHVKPVNNILYYEKGDNLTAILTAIGSRNVTLMMDTIAAISANTTIPANVNVAFSPYGGFNVANAVTLQIKNMEPPGRYKVFYKSGTGNTTVPMGVVKFPEWWGAVPDGSTSSNTAFQDAIVSKGILDLDTGTYILSQTINMIDLQIKGKGIKATGTGRTIMQFNALDATAAFTTRLASNSSIATNTVSDIEVLPNSWTAVTGSNGYGFDIESPITMTNVSVYRFYLSGIFLHGGVAGSGPYNSVFTNVYSTYNRQYGILVGTGANVLTFIQPYCANNGSPAYGVAPSAPSVFDGFRIMYDSLGNPGAIYQSYVPESIRIIGGNAFQNGGYGWAFKSVRSSILEPGYAEGNLYDGTHQIFLGDDVRKCFVNPAVVTGDTTGITNNANYYRRDNVLYVGGQLVGHGATRENWSFRNIKAYFGEASDSSSQAFIQYDTNAAIRTLNIIANGGSKVKIGSTSLGLTVSSTSNNFVGNVLWTTDNTYDIGAAGATRPRNLYIAGTSTLTGLITATNGIVFNTGSGAAGTIYGNTGSGLVVRSKTGSTDDFVVTQPGGANIISIATGTKNVKFTGSIEMAALLISATAPTISSGFGTSPTISVNNGTASFRINVGTGGTASTGVIGLPTSTTGWNCFCDDMTTTSATVFMCKQTASTTTTASIAQFTTAAIAGAWVASDILLVSCFAN